MAKVCAECGAELIISIESDGSVLGTCEGCGTSVRMESEAKEVGEEGGETSSSPRGCRSCGAALSYEEDAKGDVIGTCGECGKKFTFALRQEGSRREGGRGYGGGRSQSYGGRGRGGPAGPGGPAGRGCRQCGSPLEFTSNADGSVTGKCTSCENQFTLPPRRDGGGGGGYGRGGGGGGGYGGGRGGGGGGYGRGGGGGGGYGGGHGGGGGGYGRGGGDRPRGGGGSFDRRRRPRRRD